MFIHMHTCTHELLCVLHLLQHSLRSTDICARVFTLLYIYICICITYMYVCISLHTAWVYMYVYTYIYTCVQKSKCTYIYVYICTYMYTYVYIRYELLLPGQVQKIAKGLREEIHGLS